MPRLLCKTATALGPHVSSSTGEAEYVPVNMLGLTRGAVNVSVVKNVVKVGVAEETGVSSRLSSYGYRLRKGSC